MVRIYPTSCRSSIARLSLKRLCLARLCFVRLCQLFAVSACLTGADVALARPEGDLTLSPSTPGGGGTDVITITKKDGTTIDVEVVVDPADLTTSAKKSAIVTGLADKGITGSETGTGVNVSKASLEALGGVTSVKWKNVTSESKNEIVAPAGISTTLAFGGTLSGAAPFSAIATYNAAIGFNGGLFSSSVSYTSLVPPTVDNLLLMTYTNLYNQLPPALQSSLTLDLLADQISFTFPASATNPLVWGGTADLTAISSVAMVLPEPSALALLTCGVVAGLRRRRR